MNKYWGALLAIAAIPAMADYDCSLKATACTRGSGDIQTASVVYYNYVDNQGVTNNCSGVILARANAATAKPLMLTATHCVYQRVPGNTINLKINFNALGQCVAQADMVRADSLSEPVSTTGTILVEDDRTTGTDTTLIELDLDPPSTLYYAGWDAKKLAAGDSVEIIGHGAVLQQSSAVGIVSNPDFVPNQDLEVRFSTGMARGGHSGSPFFDANGKVVADISGATCVSDSQDPQDEVARGTGRTMTLMLPLLRPYLDPDGTGVTSAEGYYAPKPITVTLSSTSDVGSVTLSWSSTVAKDCTASGGWTGVKGTSGSETINTTQSTSYTLTCTDGTRTKTASLFASPRTASTPPATPSNPTPANPAPAGPGVNVSGGSGGGSLNLFSLLVLIGGTLLNRKRITTLASR